MKNFGTHKASLLTTALTLITFMSFGQDLSRPLNDTRCRAYDVARTGAFDINSVQNLGTTNPDVQTITGRTTTATTDAGEFFGSAAGAGGTQHTVWYSVSAPSCGAGNIRLTTDASATDYNTRLTVYKRSIPSDCGSVYKEIASNDDDAASASGVASTLTLTQGSGLARSSTFAAGDQLFVQISGYNGASGNYGLTVDVDAPNISVGTVKAGAAEITFPLAAISFGTVTHIYLRYRKTGSDIHTYTEIDLPGTTPSTRIKGLTPGVSYDVWAVYSCEAGDKWVSRKEVFTTPLPIPSAPLSMIISPMGSDCHDVSAEWMPSALATTYTMHYKLAGSRTESTIVVSAPTTSLTTGPILLDAATYQFWMEVQYSDGSRSLGPIVYHTTCGAMARVDGSASDENTVNQVNPEATNNLSDMSINSDQSANVSTQVGEMNVFPNPATIETNISYNLPSPTETMDVLVYNIEGRLIKVEHIQQPATSGQITLSLADFVSGLYSIQIQSNNFQIIKKIIVDKE